MLGSAIACALPDSNMTPDSMQTGTVRSFACASISKGAVVKHVKAAPINAAVLLVDLLAMGSLPSGSLLLPTAPIAKTGWKK